MSDSTQRPSPQTPFAARAAELMTDVAGIAGAVLIVTGVALIYAPAAFIVAGAFLMAGAWLLARRAHG
jgi:hypothetical protein